MDVNSNMFCVRKTTRDLKIFILQRVNSQTFIMERSQMTNTHTNQCKAALTRRIIQTTCLGLSETDVNQIQMCFHQYGGCGELIMKWNWSGKLICKPVFFPVSWDPALLVRVCVCVCVCVYVLCVCHVREKTTKVSWVTYMRVGFIYWKCICARL